jgi:hypothetical protein
MNALFVPYIVCMCYSWKINYRVYVLSGEVWQLVNPITLELISLPSRHFVLVLIAVSLSSLSYKDSR